MYGSLCPVFVCLSVNHVVTLSDSCHTYGLKNAFVCFDWEIKGEGFICKFSRSAPLFAKFTRDPCPFIYQSKATTGIKYLSFSNTFLIVSNLIIYITRKSWPAVFCVVCSFVFTYFENNRLCLRC